VGIFVYVARVSVFAVQTMNWALYLKEHLTSVEHVPDALPTLYHICLSHAASGIRSGVRKNEQNVRRRYV